MHLHVQASIYRTARGYFMQLLAIFAHPNAKSFNHALLDVLRGEADAKGHICTVCDLYADGFNPVLSKDDFESFNHDRTPRDIQAMQDAIAAADVVAFIHPIWWFGMPAIMKGWIDRVFSYGFAYGHDSRGVRPLLSGKKAILINTAGGTELESYEKTGFGDALKKLNDIGIYQFVGFEILLHRIFFEVPAASDEERRDMLETLRSDLHAIL